MDWLFLISLQSISFFISFSYFYSQYSDKIFFYKKVPIFIFKAIKCWQEIRFVKFAEVHLKNADFSTVRSLESLRVLIF